MNIVFRIFASIAATLFLLLPVSSHAQQWTSAQQELIDHVLVDWNAWMEAIRKNDVDIWLKKSPQIEGAKWWWTEEGAPGGPEAVRRNWDTIRKVDLDWIDMRPVSVLIHGDVGIIHFYGYWKAKTDNGSTVTEAKRTEAYKKINGKWSFLGGQSTPVSSKDAEPYK